MSEVLIGTHGTRRTGHVNVHRTEKLGYAMYPMDTFAKRLKWARENAGFEKSAVAARHFRWNENSYKSHENGIRGSAKPPAHYIVQNYARAYRVDWLWLLTGVGDPRLRNVVRLAGRIGAGAEISPEIDQTPDELVELPIEGVAGLTAYEVAGDSMYPRYEDGDLIVCGAKIIDGARELYGHVCAVALTDGRRYLKRVERGEEAQHFNLESINRDSPTIRGVTLEWGARILLIMPKGMWNPNTLAI